MKLIKIESKENYLIISETKEEIIDSPTISYYTFKYIKYKKNIMKKTLTIDKIIFNDFTSFLKLYNLINSSIIVFNINKSVPKRILDIILKMSNIKKLECYFIPSDYVHLLSNKGISITFNNNLSFTLDFITNNNLNNLKSIYYKKTIIFDKEEEVTNNLIPFLSINTTLKLIKLHVFNIEIINYIITNLSKYNLDKVNIFIYQSKVNNLDNDSIKKLKIINKKYTTKERTIKIIYSNEFFNKVIFKELTINGLKLSMIFILYISTIFIFSSKYHEYINYLNLRKLEMQITEDNIGIDEIDDTITTPIETDNTSTNTEVEYVNKYKDLPTSFETLKEINSEVVAWIKISDSKINYPVVMHSDNKYYLSHDLYNESTASGWVFMDYRNDPINLNKNTIIYAHALKTGYMFGELRLTLRNKNNDTISLTTLDGGKIFKVFSTYITSDDFNYLTTEFISDEEFMNYINLVKSKSTTTYNVEVKETDKIITLSTCSGKNRRFVAHAVLTEL